MAQRHALVTGAGGGIGRAIALQLAAAGHAVSLAGRKAAALEQVAAELRAAHGIAQVLAGFDVTDEGGVGQGIDRAVAGLGDIAVLVNCAGEAPSAPFEHTSLQLWQQALAVNLTGVFLVTRAALPSIRRAGGGRIINIASTAALAGYPYVAAYCAAKHGVIGLTRSLAQELARSDVTANAVCPGYTATPLLDAAIDTIVQKTGRSRGEAGANLLRDNPQGRFVTPEEVAHTVLWLAGGEAGAVTGQAIVVAGGAVMAG